MKFLKNANVGGKSGFSAKFTNGESTKSHDAACFFMNMQDKGATASELEGYIRIGKMVDPQHDWEEIERIYTSFAGGAKRTGAKT